MPRIAPTTVAPQKPRDAGPGALMDVTAAQTRALGLTEKQTAIALSHDESLVDALAAELTAAEKKWGDDDGSLEPRHVAQASQSVKTLMQEVWKETGKKTLSLAELRGHLPAAVARLVGSDAAPALSRRVSEHAVTWLAREYRQCVLVEGREAPSTFAKARGVTYPQWQVLCEEFPKSFPELDQVGTPAWRLEGLAAQWADAHAGKVTRQAFLRRTGLSLADIEALSKKHPDLFPPLSAEAPKPLSRARLETLSDQWQAQVVGREVGIERFLADHALSKSALKDLREDHPDLFPAPGTSMPLNTVALSEDMARAVGRVASRLQKQRPLATVPDIIAEWNGDVTKVNRYGELEPARYYNLRAKFKDAFPTPVRGDEAKAFIEKAAKGILKEAPGLSFEELCDRVTDRVGPLKPSRLKALKSLLPKTTKAVSAPGSFSLRSTAPVVALYRLAVKAMPPGTPWPEIAARVDEHLRERGVETVAVGSINRRLIFEGQPSLEEHQATVVSEILAEYARAAPKGASEGEILAAVVADYPRLKSFYLNKFRTDWENESERFEALKPFIHRGKLTLEGQGDTVRSPRYLGGWDVDRAVLGVDKKELDALVGLVETARVDVRLPLLDKAKEKLVHREPLARTNVLWVSHLLGNTFPLALALADAGAAGERVNVVGSPYGSNASVADAMRGEGFKVDVPSLSVDAYRKAVEEALDRTVAAARKNKNTIVVVDDGGLVAELLHSDPKYADVLGQVRIVEQTTRGIMSAEQSDLKVPVIAVARSRSKEYEARFIGRVVTAKMLFALERLGKGLKGREVAVVGFGFVGQALAKAMQKAGARVTVVERSEERAAAARKAGFDVSSIEVAARKVDVLVGSTGKTSISLETLKLLKDGAVVASASSKQIEIDMQGLAKKADERKRVEGQSPALRLPDVNYQLDGKQLTVVGDGWPVNFDGDVAGLPADEIQITLTALFAGALQAADGETVWKKGVIPLDPKTDAWLLDTFKDLRQGITPTPISNPDDWANLLRELGDTDDDEVGAHKAQTLDDRFRLRDRDLAAQIAKAWNEHPAHFTVEERLEALLGEPITIQQYLKLRDAHPDVLGTLGARADFPKDALERVARAVNAEDRPSLDVLAQQFNDDPVLSGLKENWTRGVIKHLIKLHPEAFERA